MRAMRLFSISWKGTRDFKKACYTVLICVLAGPLSTSIFLQFLVCLRHALVGDLTLSLLAESLYVFPVLLIFGYFVGGFVAGLGGILLALYGYFVGRPPLWFPLGGISVLAIISFLLNPMDESWRSQEMNFLYLASTASIFAVTACWYAVVKILYKDTR